MKKMKCKNLKQCYFFICNGQIPYIVDKDTKDDKIYMMFKRTEEFEEIFGEWCNRKER